MDGFKTDYNIDELIKNLQYSSEPWTAEWDAMSQVEKDNALKKKHIKLEKIVGNKFSNIPTPSTVDRM